MAAHHRPIGGHDLDAQVVERERSSRSAIIGLPGVMRLPRSMYAPRPGYSRTEPTIAAPLLFLPRRHRRRAGAAGRVPGRRRRGWPCRARPTSAASGRCCWRRSSAGWLLARDRTALCRDARARHGQPVVLLMILAWLLAGRAEQRCWPPAASSTRSCGAPGPLDLRGGAYAAAAFLACALVSTSTGTSFGTLLICGPLLYPAGAGAGAHRRALLGAILAAPPSATASRRSPTPPSRRRARKAPTSAARCGRG